MTETVTQDSSRAALVDKGYLWRPITPATPRGTKLQLINRGAGVATYGALGGAFFWTHWAPLPTFADDGVPPLIAQQPVARGPLTPEQREAIWQECRYDNGEGWEVDCWEVINAVERMHGIKGGQS